MVVAIVCIVFALIVLGVWPAWKTQSEKENVFIWQGLSVFGKWSTIICAVILVNLVFTLLLSLEVIELSHIKSVLDHSFSEITGNATSSGSIAIGETVLIMYLWATWEGKRAHISMLLVLFHWRW